MQSSIAVMSKMHREFQDVFKNKFNLDHKYSLKEALYIADIEPEGRFHDGLDDAVNTGLLIEKLEMNPDFKLISYELPESEEHLTCKIGDLFAELQLQLL